MHDIKTKKIRRLTADCVEVTLDIPDYLKKDFDFIPGQYVVLSAEIDGQDIRRSYSLCTAPYQEEWSVAIKRVEGGKFSTFANTVLKEGDLLKVRNPEGSFKLIMDGGKNTYVAFAGGSGITPVMSMVRAVMHAEPGSDFILFYGNRTIENVIFRKELDQLKNKYMTRLSVHHILSGEPVDNPLFSGRIDDQKCQAYGNKIFDPAKVEGFYLCGPSGMIFQVRESLIGMGVDAGDIHFELFSTDGIKPPKILDEEVVDEKAESQVTIILDDEVMEIPLAYAGPSILDAGLDAGADLPYACKGAVCSTCKAKVLEGEVKMKLNYALEPDEIERGFVLTCQSHPRSEKVVISFDET